jgi:teichuronic acid exporter
MQHICSGAEATDYGTKRVESRAHLSSGRARAAVTGVGWSFLNTATATAAMALVFLVTSRFLEPSDFGLVALAASIVGALAFVTPLSFADALVQRAELLDDHLDTLFWLCVGAGGLVFALSLFLAAPLADLLGAQELAQLLPFLVLKLVFDLLAAVPSALVARAMNFRAIAFRTLVATAVGGTVCIWLVLSGFGYWALAASQVVVAGVGFLVLVPAARWRPGRLIRPGALRDLWSYGMFSSGSRLLNDVRLDQFLLGVLAGATALGHYFFARRLFDMLSGISAGAFASVSHVTLSSMQSEPEKRRRAFLAASFASTSFAFPLFAGLAAIADTAVPVIFGPQWVEAVPAVQAFALLGILAGLGIVQSALIRSHGKANWWFWYEAASQITVLPVIYYGYAFGLPTLMALLVMHRLVLWPASVWMTMVVLDLRISAYLRCFLAPALATLIMTIVVARLPSLMDVTDPSWALVAQVTLGAIVYLLLLAAFGWRQLHALKILVKS